MKTGIVIKTSFFPLALLLFLTKPKIVINGKTIESSWGKQFFELAPGTYTVSIYFKYLWLPKCGFNQIIVTICSNEIAKLSYYMPLWMYSKGNFKLK